MIELYQEVGFHFFVVANRKQGIYYPFNCVEELYKINKNSVNYIINDYADFDKEIARSYELIPGVKTLKEVRKYVEDNCPEYIL